MKRVFYVLLALAVLAFGVWRAVLMFASAETKIRWRIEEMVEGFNDTRLSHVLGGFAPTFEEERSHTDKESIMNALRAVFFQEKDPKTKRFPYRLEIDPSTLQIEVEPKERKTATTELDASLYDTRNGQQKVAWRFHAHGELAKDDDDGWQYVRALCETHEGSRSLR